MIEVTMALSNQAHTTFFRIQPFNISTRIHRSGNRDERRENSHRPRPPGRPYLFSFAEHKVDKAEGNLRMTWSAIRRIDDRPEYASAGGYFLMPSWRLEKT